MSTVSGKQSPFSRKSLRPKDPGKVIETINPKKIQENLDMTAPDGAILVRPNRRLNVLAINTRNNDATKAPLTLTTLHGIAVLAYDPLPRESAAGVIYEVPGDLTEVEPQLAARTTAPVISIRRLYKSETVKLVFSVDTLPDLNIGSKERRGDSGRDMLNAHCWDLSSIFYPWISELEAGPQ
ncbi:hypothetical protein HPB47_013857 [Ixodes persulcatus]|uniref:Uncharacterized protein n=1 Tax=Ixodes persulcatus TaxID=34615 RepID=A0AC60QZC1_IXOPE|nr:hypothetical protein HPB47_013857 [Ixodes persulcatus]